jgi:hypothetical protein
LADPNPWDVLPREKVGDSDSEPLFSSVGKALTAWEMLDNFQGFLFGSIVASRRGAAEVAYGSVASGPGRGGMVIAAADRLFAPQAPELVEEITDLVNDVGRMLGRRNDIAHGVVTEYRQNGEKQGIWLVPPNYNSRRHLNETKHIERMRSLGAAIAFSDESFMFSRLMYAYTAKQVDWYANHFVAYRRKVWDLMTKVHERREKLFPSHDRSLGPTVPPVGDAPETKD